MSAGMTDTRGIWFRLMLMSFLANGLGPFGLKVLAEAGLGQQHQFQYLVYWYLGGFVFTLLAFIARHREVRGIEIALGGLMGAASLAGQSFTSLALSQHVPGHIVFPMTTGGSLLVVATAGILLFKERVTAYGVAGIVLGIIALMTLSLA
jgi:multidrug transporter EmrE-like cation transporter